MPVGGCTHSGAEEFGSDACLFVVLRYDGDKDFKSMKTRGADKRTGSGWLPFQAPLCAVL